MTPQWLTRSLCRFKDGNEISFNEEKKGRDTLLVGIASGMRGSFGTKCNKSSPALDCLSKGAELL